MLIGHLCIFFSGFFQGFLFVFDFFCGLSILCNLNSCSYLHRCIFFQHLLFHVLWAFWTCDLLSVINLRKFSAIIPSNIFPMFFFSSGIPVTHILLLFHSSWTFCSFSFFLLAFQFGFYWHIFKLTDSPLAQSSLHLFPLIKGILNFQHNIFNS